MKSITAIFSSLLYCLWCTAQSPGGVGGAWIWYSTVKDAVSMSSSPSVYLNFLPAIPAGHAQYTDAADNPSFTHSNQETKMGVLAPLTPSISDTIRILTMMRASRPKHTFWGDIYDHTYILDYNGYVPEYIVWQRILSPIERLRAESYLALRYGITLQSSYYDETGNLIWDRDANRQYHHRVSGMTHNSSYPHGTRFFSTTAYDDHTLTTSYKQAFADSLPAACHLLTMSRDTSEMSVTGNYMVWGDNGNPTTTVHSTDTTGWHIMSRLWLMNTRLSKDSVGSTIFLGYEQTGDTALLHRIHNHSYLIIDPSGEGDLSIANTALQYVASSGFDTERKCLRFAGVHWDADQNGTDVFTFGWNDGLQAEINPVRGTCTGQGAAACDGKIIITVSSGTPFYEYNLEGIGNDLPHQSGLLFSDNCQVTGLSPGLYCLTLKQLGGKNYYSSTASGEGVLSPLSLSGSGYVRWRIADGISHYRFSFTDGMTEKRSVEVSGNQLICCVNDNVVETSPIATGDEIKLRIIRNLLVVYKNGTLVSNLSRAEFDRIELKMEEDSRLYNLSSTYDAVFTPLTTDVIMEDVSAQTFIRYVYIGTECDDSMPNDVYVSNPFASPILSRQQRSENVSAYTSAIMQDRHLRVTHTDALLMYHAELEGESDQAMLMIYDASGRLVCHDVFPQGSKIRQLTFSLPHKGVYILKALTDSQEYTCKLIVQ